MNIGALLIKVFISINFISVAYGQVIDPMAIREPDPFFKINYNELNNNKIQYYYQLVNKDGTIYEKDFSFNLQPKNQPTFSKYKSLDIAHTWDKRENKNYYITMTRVAYIANKDISFFSKNRSLDPNYMNQIATGMNIQKSENDTTGTVFFIPRDGLIPSANFSVQYFDKALYEHSAPAEVNEVLKVAPIELGLPDHVIIQKNYNFGSVMMISPAEASTAVTFHYRLENGKTLVLNYTLNYLNHIFGLQDTLYEETAGRVITGIKNVKNLETQQQTAVQQSRVLRQQIQ